MASTRRCRLHASRAMSLTQILQPIATDELFRHHAAACESNYHGSGRFRRSCAARPACGQHGAFRIETSESRARCCPSQCRGNLVCPLWQRGNVAQTGGIRGNGCPCARRLSHYPFGNTLPIQGVSGRIGLCGCCHHAALAWRRRGTNRRRSLGSLGRLNSHTNLWALLHRQASNAAMVVGARFPTLQIFSSRKSSGMWWGSISIRRIAQWCSVVTKRASVRKMACHACHK
jgi:hypothetical protein